MRNLLWAALALVIVSAGKLEAQSVIGRVLDASTGTPVGVASIALLKDSVVVATALADSEGEFRITAPDTGHYQVRAGRIGYVTATGERILLNKGEYVTVEIRLEAHGIALEPLRVTARSRLERGRDGFARRRESGKGWFLTRDSIRARNPLYVTDAFMNIPGIRVRENFGGVLIQSTKGNCLVVFGDHMSRPLARSNNGSNVARMQIDGPRPRLQPRSLGGGSAEGLNQFFRPGDLEGIEIYRSFSEVPKELRGGIRMSEIWPAGYTGACGIAIVWSKAAW